MNTPHFQHTVWVLPPPLSLCVPCPNGWACSPSGDINLQNTRGRLHSVSGEKSGLIFNWGSWDFRDKLPSLYILYKILKKTKNPQNNTTEGCWYLQAKQLLFSDLVYFSLNTAEFTCIFLYESLLFELIYTLFQCSVCSLLGTAEVMAFIFPGFHFSLSTTGCQIQWICYVNPSKFW